MGSGPLNGVRVLEFSQIVALPFAGCVLSDLGAEVIKVEAPTGDPHRNAGAVVPGQGKRFMSLNRGKQSLAVDLRRAEGLAIIYRLMPRIDVVTTNFSTGVPERLKIDYDTLRGYRPDLIYCELTGFGTRGPMRDRAGTDVVLTAYSGMMMADQKIDADGLPENITALPVADYGAGFSAAVGVCAALYHRALTGEGQKLETSLLQASVALQDTAVLRDAVHDTAMRDPLIAAVEEARQRGDSYREVLDIYTRGRRGGGASLSIFRRPYQAKDGVIVLGALTPAGRAGARRVLGIDDHRIDEPGQNTRDPEVMATFTAAIAQVRATMLTRTVADWLDTFTAAGVPCGPLQMAEELADDPQVQALGLMAEVDHPLTGHQRVAGPVVSMSGTPTAVQGPSPALGADTDAVLTLAGYASDEIAALRADGVLLPRG